ncbi:MAG: site-specific integrase [Mesorhizobium sp.]
MASIIERKRQDGKSTFTAQIAVRVDGTSHRENKTFSSRREAVAWGKHREDEIRHGPGSKGEDPTLAEAIERYEKESKRLGRTKAQVLRSIRLESDIAKKRCSTIKPKDIVAYATELAKTRSPATVSGYMLYLSGVFKIARPAWGYPLEAATADDALTVARKLELTGRSRQRDRRPTLAELNKLLAFFSTRSGESLPMVDVTLFAIFSTRREGEIVRILWSDLEEEHGRILVRDAKDPRGSSGNNIWTELTPEALRIIKAQPKTGDRIFPFKGDTINFAWRNACNMLAIEDLKFHDLRHEAVSRLFEMGRTIPQVASVSGHRSWQNLQRYTHIRASGDKFAGWEWLEKIAPPKPEQA